MSEVESLHAALLDFACATLLHAALLDVARAARCDKVPDLARYLEDTAHTMLDLCQRDERAAGRFATLMLSGLSALRETTGQLRETTGLPESTARAFWRLISLLEYLSDGQ